MINETDLRFEPLREKDIPELTQIMKRAFDEDSRRHRDNREGGPPGYDDGSFIKQWGLHPKSTAYMIFMKEKLIGLIIVFINPDGQNFLGNMFVDPEVQDKGAGTAIWNRVEKMYPETRVWRTDTAASSRRNHHFYINKCGFHLIKIENPKNQEEASYILEKIMPSNNL